MIIVVEISQFSNKKTIIFKLKKNTSWVAQKWWHLCTLKTFIKKKDCY